MAKKLEKLTIPSSRIRLLGLSLFAFLALFACIGLFGVLTAQEFEAGFGETYFPDQDHPDHPPAWLFPGLLVLIIAFLSWGIIALVVAVRMHPAAYVLDAHGAYFNGQSNPAFQWSDVKGATLARGKRRSSIVFILDDPRQLNRSGMLPHLMATFLGRPTDRDIAMTNMDTKLGLQAFLDLIAPYLATYGQAEINQRDS